MELLSTEEIQQRLEHINPAWALVGGTSLERIYEFPDFNTGLVFVNEIGKLAENLNHHPDITLSWGKVVVTCASHDAGGLTQKDFDFASTLDKSAV